MSAKVWTQIPLFKNERRLALSARCILLGGPGGYLTVVPADTLWTIHGGRYLGWIRLMSISSPLTEQVAKAAKLWAVRTFGRSV